MHEKDIGNPHFCIHLDTKTRIDLNKIILYKIILLNFFIGNHGFFIRDRH